ncbi:MAG: hypothetical protein WDN31_04715 [Hyphomicrobium sp.]
MVLHGEAQMEDRASPGDLYVVGGDVRAAQAPQLLGAREALRCVARLAVQQIGEPCIVVRSCADRL